MNIEIKNWPDDRDFDPTERLADAVVDRLRHRGELDDGRALVSSFHLPTIDRVHELAPELATGWLLGLVENPHDLVARAADAGTSPSTLTTSSSPRTSCASLTTPAWR